MMPMEAVMPGRAAMTMPQYCWTTIMKNV